MSKALQKAQTASDKDGDEIILTPKNSYAVVEVYGTFSGTVNFQAKVSDAPNGAGYLAIKGTNISTGSEVTSTTAPGIFRFNVIGLSALRTPTGTMTSGAVSSTVRLI